MNRIYLLIFYMVVALFYVDTQSSAMAAPLIQQETLCYKLTSPLEKERYSVLQQAMNQASLTESKDLKECLTSLREKNFSTLIYVLMEVKNPVLYEIDSLAKKALEHSNGSFPNIAYYYGRVNCEKGIKELFRLYKIFDNQKLFICKALGETKTDEAINFLISEAKFQKKAGEDILSFLAGLRDSKSVIDKAVIEYFLSTQINREELIALSCLQTNLTEEDILHFYNNEGNKNKYVIQYLFSKPVKHFKCIQRIVKQELDSKNYEKILQWMKSDSFRLIKNDEIQDYRKKIITFISESP